MKIETIKKLDGVAKACVDNLKAEVLYGMTTPESVASIRAKTKNPTAIEVVKAMLRDDMKRARQVGASSNILYRTVLNASKSSEQFNYLANAIDSRMKRRAWADERFEAVYRGLFRIARRTKRAAE